MLPIIERRNTLLKALDKVNGKAPGHKTATLVAVSKGQSVESIQALLEAGHRDFGENRVQEALSKWPALKEAYPDIRLHLIGSLQSNKTKEALGLFNVIHTLDRESLIDALAKSQAAATAEFLVQVNTGEEPQKGGVSPKGLDRLIAYCRAASVLISGLMCIPPAGEPPAPHFALLHTLAQERHLPYLSMGMSADYDMALRLGATHIRIGTALFGERHA